MFLQYSCSWFSGSWGDYHKGLTYTIVGGDAHPDTNYIHSTKLRNELLPYSPHHPPCAQPGRS